MIRIVEYATAVTATANYCQITASTASIVPQTLYTVPAIITAGTFFASANTGSTGGVIQPIILGADGTWRNYGTATTITAAGFLFLVSITSPVLGIGIAITTTVTGGSVYLECDAAII